MIITRPEAVDFFIGSKRARAMVPPLVILDDRTRKFGSGDADPKFSEYFVYDLIEPTSSILASIRSILLDFRSRQLVDAFSKPFLFFNSVPTSDLWNDLVESSEHAFGFEYSLSSKTGEFDWLLLGSQILCAPLFMTFLNDMSPTITVDFYRESLALIDLHLLSGKPQ